MTANMEMKMTRKSTTWYPGKPGPAPTGLKRTIPLPLMLDADEFEYLSRLEEQSRTEKHLTKKAQIIRARTFRPGWRRDLDVLRKKQGANIP